jgi:hypothetical protein
MANNIQKPVSTRKPSQRGRKFEIELHKVPIVWDMENVNLSFFGIDSALFWTDPSLVYMLAPLAEEVGIELFRLIVAYSSSFGTKEDYHGMVTTLWDSFEEGFLAWGKLFLLLDGEHLKCRNTIRINSKQLQNEIEIRKEAEANKEMLIIDLQKSLKEVKALRGLLPICSSCKKVRDDKGYWNQIESYIQERSDAEFSHSICPECAKKLYPDLYIPND